VTTSRKISIYLEVGRRRTFAAALDWPGWCRSGKDEAEAVAALVEAGPRYQRALRSARLEFEAPASVAELTIRQRVPGTATTDFGAPDQPVRGDTRPLTPAGVRRLQAILRACWKAFDQAARKAEGKSLRKGPRGGGRDLDAIRRHVLEAEAAYLARVGHRPDVGGGDTTAGLRAVRRASLVALAEVAPLGQPPAGPRGGQRWSALRFARRAAWHVLDHAWEIEDRINSPSPARDT